MRKLNSDVFNVLLPASKVSKALDDINTILNTDNINKTIQKNIAKAEFYTFNYAETTKPISIDFIKEISKILFMDSYSWAGHLRTDIGENNSFDKTYKRLEAKEIKKSLNNLIAMLVDMWEDIIELKDLQYWVLAYSYYSILRIQPFFDGNELVAQIFMNFLAVKLGLAPISLKPKRGTKEYKSYILMLKEIDETGNVDKLKIKVSREIRRQYIKAKTTYLSEPGEVLEQEIEGEYFYD